MYLQRCKGRPILVQLRMWVISVKNEIVEGTDISETLVQ